MTGNPPKTINNDYSNYRALLGDEAWERLHPDIQKRFSVEYVHRDVTYEGVMDVVFMSWFGNILAQCCRLLGTPLAFYKGKNVPITVHVYPDHILKGMTWDRSYYFNNKKINRVKSTKCIQSQSGLVELVGFGLGMYLKASEKNGAIIFESTQFFCEVGEFKIPIPHLLSPGKTVVVQTALEEGAFRFDLDVVHPILGAMYKQSGVFVEL